MMFRFVVICVASLVCSFAYAQGLKLPQFKPLPNLQLQIPPPKPVDTFRDIVSQVQGFINQFVASDLQAAIDDANAQVPPDVQGVACWTDLKNLIPPQIPEGAAVAYLIQKARDFKLQLAKTGADCAFAPKIVQAMLQLSVTLDALGP